MIPPISKIASYQLFPIETGTFALDGGALFGMVPKNLWCPHHKTDQDNRIQLALRSLLITSPGRVILIDTGIGDKGSKKFNNIYQVNHLRHSLAGSLKNLGLSPVDVTDVILTHLHFDHAGGTIDRIEGERALTFPNARHYVQAAQWHWAHHPSPKDQASFISENFSILADKKDQLVLLDGPSELAPGIELITVYGHTPAMQLVKISDGQTTVLYCADLIPIATQLPLTWVTAYDNNPLTTIEEKKQILTRAVEENWLLVFDHDPLRAAATVRLSPKGSFELNEEIRLTRECE